MIHPDSQAFVVLQSVDSTNNYAMAQVHAGMAKHGQVFFAIEQTAGKGQRGKSWETGAGENIAMSMVIEPERFSALTMFTLSALVAISCRELVSELINAVATIKWPNDIYINDRKAGGILIENQFKGQQWKHAVAGIGINVNRTIFPGNIPNPVSIKTLTGKDYDQVALAQTLSKIILHKLQTVEVKSIIDDYNQHLYKKDETVSFRKDNVLFQARVIRVSELGKLVVFRGFEQELEWGEVEWKIPLLNG